MINIENTEVYGWEAAIRGMRNPIKEGGQYYLWSNSSWAVFTHWRALPEPPERLLIEE